MKKLIIVFVVIAVWSSPAPAWVDGQALGFGPRAFNSGGFGSYNSYYGNGNVAIGVGAIQTIGHIYAFDRQMKVVEREQAHRHQLQNRLVDHAINRSTACSTYSPTGAALNRSNKEIRRRFQLQRLEKEKKRLEELEKRLEKIEAK